ncbi:MAG TPA: hypothetical protein VFM18_16135, partial [Methanosarcina sp.]|nr:hypothetical protein [Methanosarcina sp.]
SNNEIVVNKCSGIATTGSLYFYIPWVNIDGSCDCKVRICLIPDGSIIVDGKQFDGLKCIVLQDVNDSWYVEVVRNDSNLSMSVGANVEIKSFTVRW